MTHLDMTYTIIDIGDGWDVRDVAGSRPLGLRDAGPWDTEDEARAAVESMTADAAAE